VETEEELSEDNKDDCGAERPNIASRLVDSSKSSDENELEEDEELEGEEALGATFPCSITVVLANGIGVGLRRGSSVEAVDRLVGRTIFDLAAAIFGARTSSGDCEALGLPRGRLGSAGWTGGATVFLLFGRSCSSTNGSSELGRFDFSFVLSPATGSTEALSRLDLDDVVTSARFLLDLEELLVSTSTGAFFDFEEVPASVMASRLFRLDLEERSRILLGLGNVLVSTSRMRPSTGFLFDLAGVPVSASTRCLFDLTNTFLGLPRLDFFSTSSSSSGTRLLPLDGRVRADTGTDLAVSSSLDGSESL
jgi:hypothetical protein